MSDYHEPVWDCSSYLHIQQISFNIKISSKLSFSSFLTIFTYQYMYFCTLQQI